MAARSNKTRFPKVQSEFSGVLRLRKTVEAPAQSPTDQPLDAAF